MEKYKEIHMHWEIAQCLWNAKSVHRYKDYGLEDFILYSGAPLHKGIIQGTYFSDPPPLPAAPPPPCADQTKEFSTLMSSSMFSIVQTLFSIGCTVCYYVSGCWPGP